MIGRGDIRWFRFGAPDKRRPILVLGNASVIGIPLRDPGSSPVNAGSRPAMGGASWGAGRPARPLHAEARVDQGSGSDADWTMDSSRGRASAPLCVTQPSCLTPLRPRALFPAVISGLGSRQGGSMCRYPSDPCKPH